MPPDFLATIRDWLTILGPLAAGIGGWLLNGRINRTKAKADASLTELSLYTHRIDGLERLITQQQAQLDQQAGQIADLDQTVREEQAENRSLRELYQDLSGMYTALQGRLRFVEAALDKLPDGKSILEAAPPASAADPPTPPPLRRRPRKETT